MYEDADLIQWIHNTFQWIIHTNIIMNLCVPLNMENFSTS